MQSLPKKEVIDSLAKQYGYMIIKFSDLGPLPVFHENVPLEAEILEKGTILGVYLSLIAGQGAGEGEPGLYGPIPWNETPNHNLMVFAFLANDPEVQDERAKKFGVMVFIVIFQRRTDDELVRARIALEKALSKIFSFEAYEDFLIIKGENLLIFYSQIKSIIYRTISEGKFLVQETAMDHIMSNTSLQFLSFYHADGDKKLAFSILGNESDFIEEVKQAKNLNIDVVLGDIKTGKKFALIKFSEYNKIAIAVWTEIITREDFIDFINHLSIATPLLQEYFGGLI